jgi:cell division initiation protein
VKVTPLDIRRKEFRRSVRGYLDEDVDAYLDTVADEFERISAVNAELQQKVKGLEEEMAGHAQMREALEKTLVAAQMQSDEMRNNAQRESQSMLREAEAKAKAVVGEFYTQTQAVQQTLMQVKLLEEDFRFKFKALLGGYLKLIDEGPLLFKGLENDSTFAEFAVVEKGEPGSESVSTNESPDLDDSPTSENAQGASDADRSEVSGATGKVSAPGPQPPRLPKTPPQVKPAADPADDLTVETGPRFAVGETVRGGEAAKKVEGAVGTRGVYFGKKDEDSDDPFPEIGGRAGKPRDFAW